MDVAAGFSRLGRVLALSATCWMASSSSPASSPKVCAYWAVSALTSAADCTKLAAISWAADAISRKPSTIKSERTRPEEHTSQLQSRFDLVCRLLLETNYVTIVFVF